MSTSQQTDPLIGRLVDSRYRVRARIARGGMATVYVATDLRLERRVALKVMHSHLSDDSVFQSRFIQEARAAARLADPHVVNVFDQGQDGEMAYLVMEYLPGITLRELLREQRRLSIPQTITIMDAILSGLAAAHRAGIVHRDVKPENVLLAEDGRIKIGDFGLARATTANTASGQMLLGTIAYLAPELVTRGTADARSDIYALGIMLYEMLVGEQPYKGEQPMQIAYQHATDSVPRPSAKNPGVPEPLDELVMWATEREPDERPADAREMLDRLREIEKELGVYPQVVRPTPTGGAAPVDDGLDSGELTKVMPGTFTAPTVTEDVDNATLLRRRTRRNARKGAGLLVLVVLLAGLAAGVGWWFGSGPGSLIAVPAVAGGTFADAEQALAAVELQAVEGSEHSREVPPGTVIGTDPGEGTRVDKGTEITVVVSAGPAAQQVPALAGMSAEAATTALGDVFIEVTDTPQRFTDATAGTVVDATVTTGLGDAAEEIDCAQGCTALEGSTAVLYVSLGPVPDVVGETLERATSMLAEVDLQAAASEEYSDTVEAGRVISVGAREGGGSFRPGDTVPLTVSKGPAPIEVPDVVGRNVAEAMQVLRDAGFEPGTALPELVWGIFTVSSTDPPAGEWRLPGSVVTVRATG
ncbi:Stk1 family PASTA domain-containing Ser/Thr kinase [Microbacterium sp. MC2]